MDALKLLQEMYGETNADEEIRDPERHKASVSMNPSHQGSTPSSSPTIGSVDPALLTDAIKKIREMYEKIDPDQQIDPLTRFIENQLRKINTQSEAESSSSQDSIETVRAATKLLMDTISSTVTERHSNTDAVEKTASSMLKVLEGIQERHWVLIALSVPAVTVERFTRVSCRDNKCTDLLLEIIKLANHVNWYNQQMPNQKEKLRNAVVTIVEGAIISDDYLKGGNRFWSDTTATAQLEKTNKQLTDIKDSLLAFLQPYWDKDVFLSHSGKQKNFIRFLHEDLTERHDVLCFFDECSLPRAEKFPEIILKAAETCKIAVVLLSWDFVRSKWPMIELAAFIRAKNGKNANLKILPIFYNINPAELKGITKDFEGWQNLEERNDPSEWQDALKEACKSNGLHLKDGNELVLKREIIKEILKQIIPRRQALHFKPVGIEDQVEKVKGLLDMEGGQSAVAVTICGFGGVGKTTLAESVYKSLSDRYSRDFKFCMVAIDEKLDITKFQKDIVKDLVGVEPDVRDRKHGQGKITEAVEKNSCVLFIDNVVDKHYAKYLLPQKFSSNKKLRIIITSREKYVQKELAFCITCKEHEVNCLSDEHSRSLLSNTILGSPVVNDKNEEHINQVADACRGVPLLLSIFGKYLRMVQERNKGSNLKESCQAVLDHLEEGNASFTDEDLSAQLMFVYYKMNEDAKEAFLDICTYFHGWKWNIVADIVDFSTLEDLHMRMLVSRNSSDEVIVHDVLRCMGKNLGKHTRFSKFEDLPEALKGVKGVSLLNAMITIPSTTLENMRESVRVLMLGDWVTVTGPLCQKGFTNLRYLHVGDITAFPFKDISNLKKLRVLVNGKRGINLSHLPPRLKRIQHEVAHGVSPFQEVQEHIQDIGDFIGLKSLNISGFNCGFGIHTLSMKDCGALRALLESLGELHSLQTLELSECPYLELLPESFGKLRIQSLNLHRLCELKKLPNSFGNMQRLKYLSLESCDSLMWLPENFVQLEMLETLKIINCPILNRAVMGKILKLQNCYMTDISGSKKLAKEWKDMQGQTERPIVVRSGNDMRDIEERRRAIKVALLHGKCMELNTATHQLKERSSLLAGLEEGTSATVAVIMLPIHMQSDQRQTLKPFVEMAKKTGEINGSGKLQIVCARKVDLYSERPEKRERAEQEDIRQILLSLPEGSCAILSSEWKRVKILTLCCNPNDYDDFSFSMAKVGLDGKFTTADEISVNVPPPPEISKTDSKHYDTIPYHTFPFAREKKSIRKLFDSILDTPGGNKTKQFIIALKENGIDHLLIKGEQMPVDDLQGKAIGFIICGFKYLMCTKLQEIYEDLQKKDSNLIWIWIPTGWPQHCGHDSYKRLVEGMPLATFPHPQPIWSRDDFIVIDKDGQFANRGEILALMGWGAKDYESPTDIIAETSSSSLEILLDGMNIVGRSQTESKMTFLYAENPSGPLEMKPKLEELAQHSDCFEVLYVGKFVLHEDHEDSDDMVDGVDMVDDIEYHRQHYEDARQKMGWPSLSFSDMIVFWCRCKYLCKYLFRNRFKDEDDLHGLPHELYEYHPSLILVDKKGVVTSGGYDVVQMVSLSEGWREEGMARRMVQELMCEPGVCSPLVRNFFSDIIDNHRQHPDCTLDRFDYLPWMEFEKDTMIEECGVCGVDLPLQYEVKRIYYCFACEWYMCWSCWMADAKQKAEALLNEMDDDEELINEVDNMDD